MQICNNLSVSATPSQLPWEGSQGVRTAGSAKEMSADLSVSLRLPAPLEGEPFFPLRRRSFPFRGGAEVVGLDGVE